MTERRGSAGMMDSASQRVQLGSAAALAALAAVGWLVTAERMDGMDAGAATDLGGLGWFVGVWATMMAAMMLPSTAPALLAYMRGESSAAATGGIAFVSGYLIAWTTAGLVAYAIVDGVRSLDPAFLAWDEGGRYLAGGTILVGALYQLTPLKRACLRGCRRPTVVRERWRPGRVGALRMGLEHGGLCIGCCWALMGALFALGVMSVGWMAFVAALIAAERLLPRRGLVSAAVALLLALLAIGVLAAPEEVPGLTVPASEPMPEDMRMMMG